MVVTKWCREIRLCDPVHDARAIRVSLCGVMSRLELLFLFLNKNGQYRPITARHRQHGVIHQRSIRENPLADPVAHRLEKGLMTGDALSEFPKHAP